MFVQLSCICHVPTHLTQFNSPHKRPVESGVIEAPNYTLIDVTLAIASFLNGFFSTSQNCTSKKKKKKSN